MAANPPAPSYDELKSIVRTHEQHAAELKAIRHEAKEDARLEVAAARAETAAAQAAAAAANEQCEKLRAELSTLKDRREKDKGALLALQEEVETAVTAAVEQEAERFRSEAKHLRAAAHKDLRQCREEGRVALAQAAAKWASEANALREAAAVQLEQSNKQAQAVACTHICCVVLWDVGGCRRW